MSCWGSNDYGQTDAPPGSYRSMSVGFLPYLRGA